MQSLVLFLVMLCSLGGSLNSFCHAIEHDIIFLWCNFVLLILLRCHLIGLAGVLNLESPREGQ